jgi:hypothetical protein
MDPGGIKLCDLPASPLKERCGSAQAKREARKNQLSDAIVIMLPKASRTL